MALGAIIGLASGLIGIGSGIFRRRKANRLERNNPYPTATVDQNLVYNANRARELAQIGLPGYNTYLQNIGRNQAGALRIAQTSGRPVNVASILRATNDAVAGLDIQDANARIANERLAMQQNAALAAENQRVWGWNEAQRYQELAGRVAQLRGAGQQDLWGGIGTLGQLAASGTFNNLFGGGGQPTAQQPGSAGFGGYNTLGNQPFGMAPYSGPMA